MKTGDHTPKPWILVGLNSRVIDVRGEDGAVLVAEVHRRKAGEANARLIAEAPEMLEILHLALAFLDVHKSPLAGRARALFDRLRDRT